MSLMSVFTYRDQVCRCKLQEMSATVIEGNDQVTGHIISTTIGGKNGEPKRVRSRFLFTTSIDFDALN